MSQSWEWGGLPAWISRALVIVLIDDALQHRMKFSSSNALCLRSMVIDGEARLSRRDPLRPADGDAAGPSVAQML